MRYEKHTESVCGACNEAQTAEAIRVRWNETEDSASRCSGSSVCFLEAGRSPAL